MFLQKLKILHTKKIADKFPKCKFSKITLYLRYYDTYRIAIFIIEFFIEIDPQTPAPFVI